MEWKLNWIFKSAQSAELDQPAPNLKKYICTFHGQATVKFKKHKMIRMILETNGEGRKKRSL